jgi:hypothetical protein
MFKHPSRMVKHVLECFKDVNTPPTEQPPVPSGNGPSKRFPDRLQTLSPVTSAILPHLPRRRGVMLRCKLIIRGAEVPVTSQIKLNSWHTIKTNETLRTWTHTSVSCTLFWYFSSSSMFSTYHTPDFRWIFLITRTWIVHRPYGRQYHRGKGGLLRIRYRKGGHDPANNPSIARCVDHSIL